MANWQTTSQDGFQGSNIFGGSCLESSDVEKSSDDESMLMIRIADGSVKDFEKLYCLYRNFVFSICYRRLKQTSYADEVVSEVFFEIWRKPSRYDSQRGSVQSYLATLARSRAVDRARKLHNESARKLQLTGQTIVRHLAFRETDSTHLEVEGREEREHILRAFEGLAELQRELMKMAFFDLMSHSEIATVTKLPIGTIKSRIRRALVRLRDLLA